MSSDNRVREGEGKWVSFSHFHNALHVLNSCIVWKIAIYSHRDICWEENDRMLLYSAWEKLISMQDFSFSWKAFPNLLTENEFHKTKVLSTAEAAR